MYGDVASNRANPFPGKLYNRHGGPDVYAGCKADYAGENVIVDNFFKVLKGDTLSDGPVLNSTEHDRVFVVFTCHGGTGYSLFPSNEQMHAQDLNDALVDMHSKDKYAERCASSWTPANRAPCSNQVRPPRPASAKRRTRTHMDTHTRKHTQVS